MGTKNNPGSFDCYQAAEPDEPMFVLLARDELAAAMTGMWGALRMGELAVADEYARTLKHIAGRYVGAPDTAKAGEAADCAAAMVAWIHERRPGKLDPRNCIAKEVG